MDTRNAIKTATTVIAECPIDGVCNRLQCGPAVMWLPCGHYKGMEKSRRGVKVRCKLPADTTLQPTIN